MMKSPTTLASSGLMRCRCCARSIGSSPVSSRRRRRPRARTISWCSPTTVSRRAPPSSSATARRWRKACATDSIHVDEGGSNEASGYLGATLTEAGSADNVVGRTIRAATKGKRVNGAVQLGEKSREETIRMHEAAREGQTPELSVMASGCLGLISFPREPGRLTLERIERLYPELVPALRDHLG